MAKPFIKKPGKFVRSWWWRDGAHRIFTNEQIKAPMIVIINEEGENLWSFTRWNAFELSEAAGLDLVQMNYDPIKKVSTVKMVDYGKYIYKKQKEAKEKKKTQRKRVLKELKLSYMIWQNDLDLKIRKAEEFLKAGYNVKMSIRLRWRERIYAEGAKKKLMWVIEVLSAVWKQQYSTPKKEAQWYSITLFAKIK